MRVHPWRSWLSAQLRGLAEAMEPGPLGLPVSEPQRAPEIAVDDATIADGDGAFDAHGQTEVVRGLNLTGAPEHWARLVRESAARGGNDAVTAATRPADSGPRRGPAPAEPKRPSGRQLSRPPSAQRDPRAATATVGGTRPATPAPSVHELPDVPADAASIPPAARGYWPPDVESREPRTATPGPRLMLRPPGRQSPRAGLLSSPEQLDSGSTGASAQVPASPAGGPTPTRLSLSPRSRAEAAGAGAVRSPAEVTVGADRGDTHAAPPGNRAAPARQRMPVGGRADVVSTRTGPASHRAQTDPPAVPNRAASADPTGVAGMPNERWPVQEPSPAEPGRWPELPTRPDAATIEPPSAVARLLTRSDRLNREQAAV